MLQDAQDGYGGEEVMANIGKVVREYISDKLGNPLMTSEEKKRIKEQEDEDKRMEGLQQKQESGEDYPADEHRPRPPRIIRN